MQGDDDSAPVTQHEEKCAEGFVCLFGFVSGVLAIVLIRFVADSCLAVAMRSRR